MRSTLVGVADLVSVYVKLATRSCSAGEVGSHAARLAARAIRWVAAKVRRKGALQ